LSVSLALSFWYIAKPHPQPRVLLCRL
jgi:hypothetical protein